MPRKSAAPVVAAVQRDVVSAVTADDLDREQLDQLHTATVKASDSCFELKKPCATVLVPTVTLVAVFTDKRLNQAVSSPVKRSSWRSGRPTRSPISISASCVSRWL